MTARWFVVMLPAEAVEDSELYGPFQSRERADKVRDGWNTSHPDDPARVLPIRPSSQIGAAQ